MLSQAGPTVALVRLGGLLVRAQRNDERSPSRRRQPETAPKIRLHAVETRAHQGSARDKRRSSCDRARRRQGQRVHSTQEQRPSGPRSQVHRRQTREGHHQDSAVAKNVRIQVSVHGSPTAPPWQVRGARDSAGLLDSIRLALLNLSGVKLGAVWRVGSVFNPARR